MLNIIQVLLRPRDIKASGSRPHPTGPDFPEHLTDSADMLVVLSGTSEDDLVTTYEYRLYRMHRLLGVKKISCAHQGERRRVKLPPGAKRRNEAVTQPRIPSALSISPASAGRLIGVVMTGTPAEDIEYAIRAINRLSALVDRNYGDEPDEADDAQRQGAEAVRRLRLLKSGLGAAGASAKSDERDEDALAA